MNINYLGGILEHSPVERRPTIEAGVLDEDWGWIGGEAELFLHATGPCCRLFTWDSLALLVRGYARPVGGNEALDLERVAEEIRCHYLEHGELAVEELDGSFTLALLDGQARRVLLYRNLVGSGFTYYHAAADGLLFGGNLAELVDAAHVTPRPNREALPAFFLYRCVPGRDTLFDGFFRLLPGEQVCWDARGLTRVQRQTFADLRGQTIADGEAVDLLDQTMERVLLDCAQLRPGTANLLSGGVDSSYLQAVWGRVTPGDALPLSFSIDIDHPRAWRDTDYAVTASRALGSRHTLVPASDPYATYLLDALAASAEPPNHVQSAYFGQLARVMVEQGTDSGLCGEGADSLFGLGLANQLHNAGVLRRLVPLKGLRQAGAFLSGSLGWGLLAATFRLADRMNDFTYLQHPMNQVAAFTDWPAVEACFGARTVAEAAAERRSLLDLYAVPDCPQERLHAAGFLGEAMDSASLWTTLFNRAGADLLCPFLDSRVLRLALSLAPEVRFRFRRPKDTLKQALARLAPVELVQRSKLGFGQPIFEWLAPGGSLRPLVERIAAYDFVDADALARTRERPTWFLYSLLCYDLWHKLFIDRSLPRPARQDWPRGAYATPLAKIGEPSMTLYSKLVRDVFLPLSLWRAGELAQVQYLREFERSQFLPPEEVRQLQWRRLQTLLQHAYGQCPFYRERFNRAGLKPGDLRGLEDLRALPVLEKRDIQEQGESMVARNWPRGDLIPNQTGGSTGTPVSFFLSKARKCSRAAATLRHNRWAGWEAGDRSAVIWGAPRDRPSDNWRARLRGALLREPLWLDTANVTEASLVEFHTALAQWRPRIIQAYARSAVLFARYLQARGLTPHRPQAIVTSAEVLEADERRLLEDVFGCPVFNRYGCREVSVVASECAAHSGLHIMAEGLYVEIETPRGPAAPGEMGAILVTDLLNHAMPMIRYRIGDLGAWASGACPCGRGLPRLERVAGRVTDFLVGCDGRLVSGVYLATYVVAQRPSLGQVQIYQQRAGAVTYRIKPGRDFHLASELEYLRATTRQYLGEKAIIDSEVVEDLPAEPSGKFLFSRSTVAPGFLVTTK